MIIPCKDCITLATCLSRFEYIESVVADVVIPNLIISHCNIIQEYIKIYGYDGIGEYYMHIKPYTGSRPRKTQFFVNKICRPPHIKGS